MVAEIDRAKKDGDTVGGSSRWSLAGVPAGLGSFAQWDRRLDGRIAQALMSIHAVKAVALGEGFAGGDDPRLRVPRRDPVESPRPASSGRRTAPAGSRAA